MVMTGMAFVDLSSISCSDNFMCAPGRGASTQRTHEGGRGRKMSLVPVSTNRAKQNPSAPGTLSGSQWEQQMHRIWRGVAVTFVFVDGKEAP